MIQGAKYWNEKDKVWYVQTNNAIEAFLQKKYAELGLQVGYLESCGISAACTCLAACGYDMPGMAEGLLFDFLNSPVNYQKYGDLGINVRTVFGNQISEAYPLAVSEIFGAAAYVINNATFEQIATLLKTGRAIQFAFSSPNHYNAALAYSDEQAAILRADPWPGDPLNIQGGWHELLTREKFTNVKPKIIVYEPSRIT